MTRFAAILAFPLVAACVAVPRATNELESARAAYRAAAAAPEVQTRAPVELQLAERALGDAERFQKADADPAMVAHFAYLAEQRARIAMKTAELRGAEAAVATSNEQRSRMQLDFLSARERERAEAQRRQAEAQTKQVELAAGQASAEKRAADERAALLSSEVSRLQGQMSELKARETERGLVLTMRNDVLFDSGAATLKPGGRKAIDNLAQLMQKQPGRGIAVEGFTDSTGSAEVNRRLSEARAAAVKQALVERGIEPARVETRGYGPAFPIASNETAVGRQLNRRVEIVITPQPSASFGGATR
jgi:outer membrane protein OmpA-like peptidoglycan-associated protein